MPLWTYAVTCEHRSVTIQPFKEVEGAPNGNFMVEYL